MTWSSFLYYNPSYSAKYNFPLSNKWLLQIILDIQSSLREDLESHKVIIKLQEKEKLMLFVVTILIHSSVIECETIAKQMYTLKPYSTCDNLCYYHFYYICKSSFSARVGKRQINS